MAAKPRGGFGISQFGIAEDCSTESRKLRVVRHQFFASIDMIVVIVILTIVVEPGLNTLGKIFVMIHRSVFAFPEISGHGSLVGSFQARIKRGIDIDHAAKVDVMSKLMNEDAFCGVGIAFVAQEILFTA